MNQEQQITATNTYILKKKTQRKKYEWYEHDLMTYILTTENMTTLLRTWSRIFLV